MNNLQKQQLVNIIYDGICNSVFQSQVLAPLVEMLQTDENLTITLVSFEKEHISPERLIHIIPIHKNLHVTIIKRPPFVGKLSLKLGTWQFYNLLKKIPCSHVIARGPLAGWIALKTLGRMVAKKHTNVPVLTVQARGLGAEEYRYAHMRRKRALWEHFYQKWIYHSLQVIEHGVFRRRKSKDRFHDITLEAVSPALKHYLIKHFNADEEKIVLATRDIPKLIEKNVLETWRKETREKLGIAHDAIVYCYCGSYKPWQCADEAVQYFIEQHQINKKSFLLILSQDVQAFKNILEKHDILPDSFTMISVSPQEILPYLAAADAGFLFREPDVINWVSRPTKMLEYQAAGVNIIHNNTVAWLVE